MASKHRLFSSIGIAGAGDLGTIIALGFAERGIKVSLWDANTANIDRVMAEVEDEKGVQENLHPFRDIHRFAKSVDAAIDQFGRRRRLFIFSVTCGSAAHPVLELMMDGLEDGDIILDGGNENYRFTERRQYDLAGKGVTWIGMGVFGGNHTANRGVSLALGGDPGEIHTVIPLLKEIAARDTRTGESCVVNIGTEGSGHYVKMVHDAIENGILSTICEAWALLRYGLGKSQNEIESILENWDSEGPLRNTFLVRIGSEICREKIKKAEKQASSGKAKRDVGGQQPTVEETHPFDKAQDPIGQDGDVDDTGWSIMESTDRHVPVPSIAAGHFIRMSSVRQNQRLKVSQKLDITPPKRLNHIHDVPTFVEQLRDATYVSILSSFCQGLELIARGSNDEGWQVNLGNCLKVWQPGSVIQAEYIFDLLMPALTSDARILNMKLIDEVAEAVKKNFNALKQVVLKGTESDACIPSLSASLEYLKCEGARILPTQFMEAELSFLHAHRQDWPGVKSR